jgi:thioester reductase-like protein
MSAITLGPATNVLVTGVTGLIGGEIIRKLRSLRTGTLYALVRPQAEANAVTRFTERMRRSGDDPWVSAADVEVVAGDVRRPRWDLEDEDFRRLTRSVDLIIHCAADTGFLRGQSVHETNVGGARTLIDFARRCERNPLIVYMSTASNGGKVSHRCLAEEDGCKPDNEHHNEYTRSKALAEAMLRDSGLPVLRLRPSIVLSAGLPDPAFAQSMLWFVSLLQAFDCLPIDPASRLDVVPVSFVVDATVALLRRPRRAYDCYHLSAGERAAITNAELNEFVGRYYRRPAPLRLLLPSQWTRQHYERYVRTDEQRKIFFGLSCYLPFLNMDVVYDNRRLREELGEALPVPPLTNYLGELLDRIQWQAALEEAARP